MQKTKTRHSFNPYQRYENAMRRILSKSDTGKGRDPWEDKLVSMLKLREAFKKQYQESYTIEFAEKFPLYSALLTAFEDTRIGGDRDLLEAMLLCSLDLSKLHESFNHPRFDAMFLGVYRKLFYDVTNVLLNVADIFQMIIGPMLSADSDKLAVGHIWKILALAGGASLLKRKGLGTESLRGEDIEHLLQLSGFRHCSTMLQYTSQGSAFFKDNPGVAVMLNSLADFDSIRGSGRRTDYLAEISNVAKNNFNSLLRGELKLLAVPDNEVMRLTEFDGQFRPDVAGTLEITEHLTFISSEGEDD